jgi:signal recognition particle receptor subunit beta
MENKIIFAGPVGSGKTTAINSVSDINTVNTEAKASDEVAQLKHNTTVAMDFGVLNLEDGHKLHLYGTPGQDRFDFMWDILSQNAMGFVILIDSTRPDPIADLKSYLNAFNKSIVSCNNTLVIGVTHTEVSTQCDLLERIHQLSLSLNLNIPIFEVDAREREDIKCLLISLISLLDPSANREKIH